MLLAGCAAYQGAPSVNEPHSILQFSNSGAVIAKYDVRPLQINGKPAGIWGPVNRVRVRPGSTKLLLEVEIPNSSFVGIGTLTFDAIEGEVYTFISSHREEHVRVALYNSKSEVVKRVALQRVSKPGVTTIPIFIPSG